MMPKKRKTARGASSVVRARVPKAKADAVRRIARESGKTPSDVVREALDAYIRMKNREKAVEQLIAMIPEKIPTKAEYAFRLGRKW